MTAVLVAGAILIAFSEIVPDAGRDLTPDRQVILTAALKDTNRCVLPGERVIKVEGDPLLKRFAVTCGFSLLHLGSGKIFLRVADRTMWSSDEFPLDPNLQEQWDAALKDANEQNP